MGQSAPPEVRPRAGPTGGAAVAPEFDSAGLERALELPGIEASNLAPAAAAALAGVADEARSELTRQLAGLTSDLSDKLDEAADVFFEPFDDAFGELSGELDVGAAGANVLKELVRSLVSLFLLSSSAASAKRRARNSAAYDRHWGDFLRKTSPALAGLSALHHWASGSPVRSNALFLSLSLFSLWFLSLYYVFTGDNYEFAWQVPAWEAEGIMVEKLLFTITLFCCTGVLSLATKLLIRTSTFEISGALFLQLMKHYAPAGVSKRQLLIHQSIDTRAQFNRACAVVMTAGGLVGIWLHHAWVGGALQVPYGAFLVVGLSLTCLVGIPSVFAVLNVIFMQSELMRRNIVAYKEAVDVFCLAVIAVELAEYRRIKGEPTAAQEADAFARVRANKDVNTRFEQMRERERFLLTVSHELLSGETGQAVSAMYAFIGLFFVSLLFRIFLDVAKLSSSSVPDLRATYDVALFVLFAFASVFLAAQPLAAMASQATAWSNLERALASGSRRQTYKALDEDLHARHVKLRSAVTWRVIGAEVSYRTVNRYVAAYAGTLWASVLFPAIAAKVIALYNSSDVLSGSGVLRA